MEGEILMRFEIWVHRKDFVLKNKLGLGIQRSGGAMLDLVFGTNKIINRRLVKNDIQSVEMFAYAVKKNRYEFVHWVLVQ